MMEVSKILRFWKIGILLVFILSYFLTVEIATAPPIGAPLAEWEPLSVSDEYYDHLGFAEITFLNETHGWLLGHRALLQTRDGGDKWNVSLAPEDSSLVGLSVLTPLDIWASAIMDAPGGYGQLFHSLDGGVTWQTANTPPTITPVVEFYNSTHGLVVDPVSHTLFRTIDGGSTWQTGVNWSSGYNPLHDIHLSVSAYRIATSYGLYLSEDWGLTWRVENTRSIEGLSFITDSEGWILFPRTVAHFVDGTLTEFPRVSRIRISSSSYYSGIEFIDSEHGWIVGVAPAVSYTPDGGLSWYEQETPDYHFRTVDFINETHGWAAGWEGAVARTTNGNSLGRRLLTGFPLTEPLTGSGYLVSHLSLLIGSSTTVVYLILFYKYRSGKEPKYSLPPRVQTKEISA